MKSRVDLGEALSRLPSGEEEARQILEPLAKVDVIGSDHAYARLMRIGSTIEIRSTALLRCETMTEDKGLCRDGFVAESQTSVWVETWLESASTARWVPRILVGLAAIASSLVLAAIAAIFARMRRRSHAIAAFAG